MLESLPAPSPTPCLPNPSCALTVSPVSAESLAPGAGCLQGTHFQREYPRGTAVGVTPGGLGLGWDQFWVRLGCVVDEPSSGEPLKGIHPRSSSAVGFSPCRAPGRSRAQALQL